MRCPYCRHADSRVVDSREADDGALIRRRRSCPECGRRFTTVEEAVRARGAAEVPSHEVGLAILGPLRELDEVAYLRFASVYRSFDSLSDFEREIAMLRSTTTDSVVPPQDSDQGETNDAQPSLANGRWQH